LSVLSVLLSSPTIGWPEVLLRLVVAGVAEIDGVLEVRWME